MNDTEKADLNRQVAEMMGWVKITDPGAIMAWHDPSVLQGYRSLPGFCTDPGAGDLVRQWLEGQRLTIEERSYEHHFEATGEYGRRYGCLIRGRGHEVWAASFREERGTALCTAALFYSKSEERKEWVRHMESTREEAPNA